MRLWRCVVIGTGLCLGLPSIVFAVTLKEIARETIATNPIVLGAVANTKARTYDVNEAIGLYLPHMSARAAGGRERSVNPTVRAQGLNEITLDRTEFSITARQLIIDGWGVGSTIQERNYNLAAAKFDFLDARNTVILDMAEAFLNVKRQREAIAIGRSNVAAHEEALRKVTLRYKGGAGTRVDVELVQARLARAQAQLRAAQGRLDIAVSRYSTVSNQAPTPELVMPTQPTRLLPPNLYAAVRMSMDFNPSVLSSIYTAQAAGAHVGVIKSRFFPRIDAEVTARADNNIGGIEGSDGAVRGMAVLTYDFLTGGSDLAAYNSSVSDRCRAINRAEDLQRKIRERIRNAWTGFMDSRDQIRHYRENVNAQRQVVRDYIMQFELGQRQLFNVLDAQDDLFTAQTSYVNASYDNAIAYYRVLESIGVLNLESLI